MLAPTAPPTLIRAQRRSSPRPASSKSLLSRRPTETQTGPHTARHILGPAQAPCRPNHPSLTEPSLSTSCFVYGPSPRLSQAGQQAILSAGPRIIGRIGTRSRPLHSGSQNHWRGQPLAAIVDNPHHFASCAPIRTNWSLDEHEPSRRHHGFLLV